MLATEVAAACEVPDEMAARICRALKRAAADPGLLDGEQREPCANGYARHVLYSDPLGRFTILAIVWGPGQFSPAHAHQTWCAYAVYDGPLHETVFTLEASCAKARPLCIEVRDPGYCCFAGAGLDQIHRLGNAGTAPAISLHVYGVERQRIATHVNRGLEIVE
jgi:predicted metal-dependent enzyme (double-stranded beta helix superfamily)